MVESAGKDFFDSPWKHQHTAPEYLEKRRIRKKSGGKLSGMNYKQYYVS